VESIAVKTVPVPTAREGSPMKTKPISEQVKQLAEEFRSALITEIGFMREDGATDADVHEYLMRLQTPSMRRVQ
jgi:hypothetical protein